MGSHIALIITFLLKFLLSTVDCALWSCSKDGNAMPVIPSQVAGVWYEIARIPNSEVPACLEVVVPESQVNGSYTLELNYVNNVNKGWKPTNESLVFPWSEARYGNFNLLYTDGTTNMSVSFKYLGSMSGYAIVCGYTEFATGLPMIRLLSRHKLVNSTIKAELDALAGRLMIPSKLTWVEQDGRCNGSENLSIFHFGLWIFLFLIQAVFALFDCSIFKL